MLPVAERQTLGQVINTLGITGMYRGTLAVSPNIALASIQVNSSSLLLSLFIDTIT
jgi:hypothetical protein